MARCCRTHALELSETLTEDEALELAKLHAQSDGDAYLMLVGAHELRVISCLNSESTIFNKCNQVQYIYKY